MRSINRMEPQTNAPARYKDAEFRKNTAPQVTARIYYNNSWNTSPTKYLLLLLLCSRRPRVSQLAAQTNRHTQAYIPGTRQRKYIACKPPNNINLTGRRDSYKHNYQALQKHYLVGVIERLHTSRVSGHQYRYDGIIIARAGRLTPCNENSDQDTNLNRPPITQTSVVVGRLL